MSRTAASQLSFADWELMRQGLELEPLLATIAAFLDDHEALVTRIRGDLRRGLKRPDTGRSGMAPGEVLRSLVLMRVKNWDYRELRDCRRLHAAPVHGVRLPAGAQAHCLSPCLRAPDAGDAPGGQ